MNIPEEYRLKNTIKYPTSIIVGGMNKLGFEIADSLIEQGGYVIIIDTFTPQNIEKLKVFPKDTLISFLDYTSLPHLEEEVRRLDYVFYFAHESSDFVSRISTQEFLNFSNYLDTTLSLAAKFDAKFLLTTAIKAQQILLSSSQFDLNYGLASTASHIIYNDTELQRYAESLTVEYHEKVKLDVRILRLGELIGDGMDMTHKSEFLELINQAISGKILKLKKDGLEQEWYVNILDAAYGLIKAQFSVGTTAKIYSLCYEHPFTHLSIAYKIQELNEETEEIQFVNERDNLPSLKLYKPAPNLTQIGWKPKVTFEKSIQESLITAKIHHIELTANEQSTVFNKLKNFLALAGENNKHEVQQDGSISKLMNERKEYEKLKKERLNLAGSDIKTKRKYKPRTFKEKFQSLSWSWLSFLGDSVAIYKNKSVTEIVLITTVLASILLTYFFIISPIAATIKNSYLAYENLRQISVNANNGNYSSLEKNGNSLSNSSQNISRILERNEPVINFLSLGDEYVNLQKMLNSYKLFGDGISDLGYALAPYEDYVENYENNTQLRFSTESYISVNDSEKSYDEILQNMSSRSTYIEVGIDKINQSIDSITSYNLNFLPKGIESRLTNIHLDLQNSKANINRINSLKYLSDLFGNQSEKSYAFIIQDNTRQMPIGGEVASIGLIKLNKGKISDLIIQSPDEIAFNFSSLSSVDLELINKRKFTYLELGELSLNDLGNIRDQSEYTNLVDRIFENSFETKIDGVIVIDLMTLGDLVNSVNNVNEKKLKIDNHEFGEDFLSDIVAVTGDNANLKRRHDIIAQIFAYTMNLALEDPEKSSEVILDTLSSNTSRGSIFASMPGMTYSSYIAKKNLYGSEISESDYYYSIGINTEDTKVVDLQKFPFAQVSTQLLIDNNFNLISTINLKFDSVGASQEVSICLPGNIEQSKINIEGISSDRVIINTVGNERCAVAKVLGEDEVTFKWSQSQKSDSEGKIPLSISLPTVNGALPTTIDYSIEYDGKFTLLEVDKSFVTTPNNTELQFTKDQYIDELLNVVFE